jgi:hypothetical protein
MTIGWPSVSLIFWPSWRAVTSTMPPAANGTTSRSGLDGNACARGSARSEEAECRTTGAQGGPA